MKIRDYLVIFLGASVLMGCPCTCRNQIVTITLLNETSDSLCLNIGHFYPTTLDTVPPYGKYFRDQVYTDDIDYHDYRAFVATLGTIKKYGMDSVLKHGLYDTIIHLSRNELEVRQYAIKIRNIKTK